MVEMPRQQANPKRVVVSSSAIARLAYDAPAKALEVEFHSGRVYRYFDVESAEFDALRNADSVGAYFNREVKPRHRVEEITPPLERAG
jgi:KTSC domain-containing protein